MNDTIYDFRTRPLPSFDLPIARPLRLRRRDAGVVRGPLVGIITNPRSRRHLTGQAATLVRPDVLSAAPATRAELRDVLAAYARQRIDLLVIDGGDGTIRDVLTCAASVWNGGWPKIIVLPSGKTNALAMDLGIPSDWTLDEALAAVRGGGIVRRAPIEVERIDTDGLVRGFIFGAGAFVQATALAQKTHKAGAFNSVAVALALIWAVLQTLFGAADGAWRRGTRMALAMGEGLEAAALGDERRYMMFASTLHHMPAGLKPFGAPRPGLKTLVIDAPPRRLLTSVPLLLSGSESPRLAAAGYHRFDADTMEVDLDAGFILDGEAFPAGTYTLRHGAPLRFVVP